MKKDNPQMMNEEKVSEAIRLACSTNLGVLDSNFMCQSISVLQTRKHPTVKESDSVESVVASLRTTKTGCVVVVDNAGKLSGIFSERDVILKISVDFNATMTKPISAVMTREPISVPPDCTIAYALNLMSQGGFRHIPIVSEDGTPIGLISVKDVVDYMVDRFVNDVMAMNIS